MLNRTEYAKSPLSQQQACQIYLNDRFVYITSASTRPQNTMQTLLQVDELAGTTTAQRVRVKRDEGHQTEMSGGKDGRVERDCDSSEDQILAGILQELRNMNERHSQEEGLPDRYDITQWTIRN